MPVTININNLTLCHKGSNGVSMATIPDVCKTPSPGGPVPIPYPNIAMSSDLMKGTTTVKADGGNICANYGSEFFKSTGDEPGVVGGVASNTFIKEATWITFSFDVKFEGKAACRLTDKMFHNHQNTVNLGGELQCYLPSAKELKAACYNCRKELSDEGKKSNDPETKEAANRLGRENHDLEQARLSDNVYDPSKPPPDGWRNISDDPEALEKYGLSPADLEKSPSEFRAQMYEPDPAVFGGDMKPTVAFKGTTSMNPFSEDWQNNLAQGIGNESSYYRNAVGIGNNIADSGASVDFTGHSLGGGLASAASGTSGMNGTTFNAAGLNEGTIAKYGGAPSCSDIHAYQIGGEILTGLQEQSLGGTLLAGAAGALFGGPAGAIGGVAAKLAVSALMSNAVGTVFDLPGSGLNPVDRHGMEQVIAGMEEQIGEDQAKLEKATGKKCNC